MTAHDPRVTLTEAVAHAIANTYGVQHNSGPEKWGEDWTPEAEAAIAAMQPHIEASIVARLAPIRALAEEATERAYWDISLREMLTVQATGPERAKVPPHWRTQAESEALVPVDALRNALDAPQEAPRGPVGGEQGAEVAR